MANPNLDTLHLERLDTYIDLDRYPIHDLDSPAGKALIAEAQEMMKRDTLCLLEGFLRDSAVAELSAEISQLEAGAHRVDYPSTIYGWMYNEGFPPEHPRSRMLRRNCSVISYDQLDAGGACRELYQFDELADFIRRLLGYDTLYRTACPTLSIQVNIMDEGEIFDWHFDTNDGVVSFTIQNADEGGGFEYAPLIRAEDDENYEGVARIVDEVDKPCQPEMTPGTLSLFLGRRSLHRSAPISKTGKTRQSLLFSYDREPGMVFPLETCRRLTSGSPEPFYGAPKPAA